MIASVSSLQRQRAREMRSKQTPSEDRLWQEVRAKRLDRLKFRRQVPMGNYIVDFFCPEHRLIVELDGPVHEEQTEYDAQRTDWLHKQGYTVLRFSNHAVLSELPKVLARILEQCGR
ncbi:MAG: endonuclease domain-containing protein [Pseudomonadota bacterium]